MQKNSSECLHILFLCVSTVLINMRQLPLIPPNKLLAVYTESPAVKKGSFLKNSLRNAAGWVAYCAYADEPCTSCLDNQTIKIQRDSKQSKQNRGYFPRGFSRMLVIALFIISIIRYWEYSSDFLPFDWVVFEVNPLRIFSIFVEVELMI